MNVFGLVHEIFRIWTENNYYTNIILGESYMQNTYDQVWIHQILWLPSIHFDISKDKS